MINRITFKNYKLFKSRQTLEIKPLTILIGKNSAGKSAILKLLPLIENSLSGTFPEPLRLKNNEIEVGGEFRDLVYERKRIGRLEIGLEQENNRLLVDIGLGTRTGDLLSFFSWKYNEVETDSYTEKFKGFQPENKAHLPFSLKTEYISSIRKGLERFLEKLPSVPKSVGLYGENVYSILIEDALTTPQALIKAVSTFFRENFEGWGITVNQDNPPQYQVELIKDNLKINFKDVGSGMIYVLPLVVCALIPALAEILIIIEEPELDLHPAAHGNLAQLFAESLRDTNKHYLIETHSQNFILRLRALIAKGDLPKESVVIYYVDFDENSNESKLVRINIDELGKPRNENGEIFWPKNIFNETLTETSAIRDAQLNRQNHGG